MKTDHKDSNPLARDLSMEPGELENKLYQQLVRTKSNNKFIYGEFGEKINLAFDKAMNVQDFSAFVLNLFRSAYIYTPKIGTSEDLAFQLTISSALTAYKIPRGMGIKDKSIVEHCLEDHHLRFFLFCLCSNTISQARKENGYN